MELKVGDRVRVTGVTKHDNLYNREMRVHKVYTSLTMKPYIDVVPYAYGGRVYTLLTSQVELIEPEKSKKLLDEAAVLVYGDRNADYGHPYEDFMRTANMWTEIVGVEVSPEKVALCMIAVKISRLTNDPTKRDSVIDIAGYAECYDRLQKYRDGEES